MGWNRIFKTLFPGSKKSCASIFEEARERKSGKSDYDYLKYVLLSKPPFDYQEDRVIENILNVFKTIDDLEIFVSEVQKDETFWTMRNKNLKRKWDELTIRNNEYFQTF